MRLASPYVIPVSSSPSPRAVWYLHAREWLVLQDAKMVGSTVRMGFFGGVGGRAAVGDGSGFSFACDAGGCARFWISSCAGGCAFFVIFRDAEGRAHFSCSYTVTAGSGCAAGWDACGAGWIGAASALKPPQFVSTASGTSSSGTSWSVIGGMTFSQKTQSWEL